MVHVDLSILHFLYQLFDLCFFGRGDVVAASPAFLLSLLDLVLSVGYHRYVLLVLSPEAFYTGTINIKLKNSSGFLDKHHSYLKCKFINDTPKDSGEYRYILTGGRTITKCGRMHMHMGVIMGEKKVSIMRDTTNI